jgi:exopolyphosphatase / guanosine-5'-triphosphate,3'-diphosphate pyrophosphatase
VRVAIVDQGTNSTRLFLAEVERGCVAGGRRFTTITRLGQGVDRHRRLNPAAAERARTAVGGFAAEIAAFAPARSLLIATSVLRDARGGRRLLGDLRRTFNLKWRVLDGAEEAAWSFRGAASAIADQPRPDSGVLGTIAVIDIGGGSTEVAVGPVCAAAPAWSHSFDVGVVRVTERFFADDPPSDEQWAAATAFVRDEFAAVPAEVRGAAGAALGVAGTYTTLVAHKLGLHEYDPARVHGHVLALTDIEAAQTIFRRLTSAQRGELAGIQPGREDVILAGALLAAEVCRLFGHDEVRVSEADLLDGAALWLAEQAET